MLKPMLHRNAECIGIFFTGSQQITKCIKTIKSIKWSQSNKCWYLLLNEANYNAICKTVGNTVKINNTALREYLEKKKATTTALPHTNQTAEPPKNISAYRIQNISKNNAEALAQFLQHLQLKSYSASTIRTYQNEFCQLLQTIKNTNVHSLTPGQLKRYMVYAIQKEGISENTAHSRLNALKFYFEQVLGREKFFWEIPRPKKRQQLPKVFSQDDIAAIIKSITNKKHKTMLMLAYSAGLRVSEVVNLKTYHIDSSRMSIFIESAKGKKDRIATLSPVLLVMLREYAKEYKPGKKGWLFEGSVKGTAYSSRSLQEVLQYAKKKAGVIRPGSIHSLRHSFATHLVERGTDITMIQKLLGHNDIKTTMIYLHTSNKDLLKIISPLDDLKLS